MEIARAQTKKDAITVRPADLLAPEWAQLSEAANALDGADGTDEDVLTYAMFPGVAPGFLAKRPEGPVNVGLDPAEVAVAKQSDSTEGPSPVRGPIKYAITLDGTQHHVTVERA